MRRAFDPRRKLRNRLLAGMLAVALLPFGVFTLLASADLGAMSQATTAETHQAILDDESNRLQSQLDRHALAIDSRFGSIASSIRVFGDLFAADATHPQAFNEPVADSAGIDYATNPSGEAGIVFGSGSGVPVQPESVRAARLGTWTTDLQAKMDQIRNQFPEIESIWAADSQNAVLMTIPPLDVPDVAAAGRITANAIAGPNQDSILAASKTRMASNLGISQWPNAQDSNSGPFWTDPYPLRSDGQIGITVWLPVDNGNLRVGADIPLSSLSDQLQSDVAAAPGSYPIIVSSSNSIVATDTNSATDFGGHVPDAGQQLAFSGQDHSLADSLNSMELSGRTHEIEAAIQGVDKLIFASAVNTPHWLLLSAVPRSDLEPDLAGLSKGIDSGIHGILLGALPLALALVLLSAALSTLFARQIVRPVNVLTKSAQRLALGYTDEAIPQQGDDEIGILSESLEHMRREINASHATILAASRELEQRVEDRTQELRARNEELLALNELAGSLNRSLDPQTIAAGGLDAMRAVLQVRAGYAFIYQIGKLHAVAQCSVADEAWREQLETVASRAIHEQKLVLDRLGDMHLLGLGAATATGPLGGYALLVAHKPSERTRALLLAITNQVALALRTAQLSAEGRDVAVLEERTRLAREIHDTLAQQLTGIILQLESAHPLVTRKPEKAGDIVAAARDLARHALAEARRSVWNLRPHSLAAEGLADTLRSEVADFARRSGISADFETESMEIRPHLEPQAEVGLLRVLQQALANVADHSGATQVTVTLSQREDTVQLKVMDNGHGFDTDAQRPGSFGIIGMNERARLSGGHFQITSDEKGTTLTIEIPLQSTVPVTSA